MSREDLEDLFEAVRGGRVSAMHAAGLLDWDASRPQRPASRLPPARG